MSWRDFIAVELTHAYRGGPCPDLAFTLPSDTKRTLARGHMLIRRSPGTLSLLVETEPTGEPLVELDGALVRLGVRVANPHFENFTELAWPAHQRVRVLRSATAPDSFEAAIDAELVGLTPSVALTRTTRPVSVSLRDLDDELLWTETIEDARSELSLDLRLVPPGRYTLVQTDVDASTSEPIYLDAELHAQGCIEIIELALTPAVYQRDNRWSVAFAARSETLRYWIVAKGLSAGELDDLSIDDEGFAEDGRAQIQFDKLLPTSFDPGQVAFAERIADGGDVILFRSTSLVARSQTPPSKLQLGRNGDVVVPNLPLPGPERPTADTIIHLTKP